MLECVLSSPSGQRRIGDIGMLVVKTTIGELGIMRGHVPVEAKLVDFSIARFVLENGTELRLGLGYSSFMKFADDSAMIMSDAFDEIAS